MESTPPVLAWPDPRRINSAVERAKTNAKLECFIESTDEGMKQLDRQNQHTFNVAAHHIDVLGEQVSSLHKEVKNVEARSGGNEGRMDVFEGRLTTCENEMRSLGMQIAGLHTVLANMNDNLSMLNARFSPPSGNPAGKKTQKVGDTVSGDADFEPVVEYNPLMVVIDTHSPSKWVVENQSDFNWLAGTTFGFETDFYDIHLTTKFEAAVGKTTTVVLDAYDINLKEMMRAKPVCFIALDKYTVEEKSFAAALSCFMIENRLYPRTRPRAFPGKLNFPDLCHNDNNVYPVSAESTSLASSTAESSTPPSDS